MLGFRYLGEDSLALDAEGPEESRAGEAMGDVSEQPPRSDCGDGLLHAVPTLTFNVLYCFFVISHDRRRILHCKSPGIRAARGSSSSFGRPSLMILHWVISFLIAALTSMTRLSGQLKASA
jgi:hypothetical protein